MMEKTIWIKILLGISLLNTIMLGFLMFDKVADFIQNRPVVISRDYDKGQSIESAMETKKPMIILFYTDWCRYCQKFAPVYKKIADKKEIKKNFAIAYVNAEMPQNEKYTKEYKIEGYPTVYVVKDGKREQISTLSLFTPNAVEVLKEVFMSYLK